MSFYIAVTTRPRLEFAAQMWRSLVSELAERGRGSRESGAFLLGRIGNGARSVVEFVAYEDLDPAAQNFEHVELSAGAFSKLWEICAVRELSVVADVHTHPWLPYQSISDRANPMIATAGHLALILPNFALGEIELTDISVNEYLGNHRWRNYIEQEAARCIRLIEG